MYVLCHLFSNLKLAHTGGWCWPNGRTCAANGNQSQSRILWDTPSNFKAAILLPKQFSGISRIQTQPTMLSGPTLVKLLHYYFSSAWRALSAAPLSLQNPSQQPTIKDISCEDGLTVWFKTRHSKWKWQTTRETRKERVDRNGGKHLSLESLYVYLYILHTD